MGASRAAYFRELSGRTAEPGAALEKVIRAAIDAAPHDYILVDFVIACASRLDVKAGPAEEMGGIDASPSSSYAA